jgi:catechol 2,3-dioxygenase-like lactoylglutathione lyase family enzyme
VASNIHEAWNEMKNRPLVLRLALFLAAVSLQGTLLARPQESRATVRELAAVGMTVSDVDRAAAFYSEVLSFQKVSESEVWGEEYEHLQGVFGLRMRTIRMQLGDELIELTEYLTPTGKPIPVDSRSNDRWFQHVAIIVNDMDRAYQRLRDHRVRHASTGPQTLPDWNVAAGGIQAYYFKDPDGHALEILNFPAGKGNPKWHRETDNLFLGIDHTAIVVEDTESSLVFYRDLLGLEVAGESENYGTEQEHLNNVFGARLRITALRAPGGPGVEFLEYIAPRDGRPMPIDVKPNDLVHWQTVMTTDDAEALANRLRAGRQRFISSGVIDLTHIGGPENAKSFLVRDPDGHAVQLLEKTNASGPTHATGDAR